jgi:hypothetical protein
MIHNRFTNIDVTINPENVSKVHSILLCEHDVILNNMLFMFLELYANVCHKSEEETMGIFEERTIDNVLALKSFLVQFGELNILPDQEADSNTPLN